MTGRVRAEEFEYWELEYAQRKQQYSQNITGFWPTGAKYASEAEAEAVLLTPAEPNHSNVVTGHGEPIWRIAHVQTRKEYSPDINVPDEVRKRS